MNVDPDAVLSVSMLDADAKVLIEMQEEDLRHRNSPGQAIQMGRAPIFNQTNQLQLPVCKYAFNLVWALKNRIVLNYLTLDKQYLHNHAVVLNINL